MNRERRFLSRFLIGLFFVHAAITTVAGGANATKSETWTEDHHYYAIVVGVDRWLGTSGFPVLLGPVNDATEIAARLRGVGYVVRLLTAKSDDQSLKPSRSNILRQVGELAELTHGETNNVFVFYYSGHGMAADGTPYIMPSDASASKPAASGLSLAQISQQITNDGGKFESFLFISDACRSGFPASSGFLSALPRVANGWAIVSACGPGEVAYEDPPASSENSAGILENAQYLGLMTKGLLLSRYYVPDAYTNTCEADKNGDGILTWSEAVTAGQDVVARLEAAKGLASGPDSAILQHPAVLVAGTALDAPFCRPDPMPAEHKPIVLVPKDNIFWLYTNYNSKVAMPFVPAGWMAGGTADCDQNRDLGGYIADMMSLDVNCRRQPFEGTGSCIDWKITWSGTAARGIQWNEGWAGICMTAVPTLPLWWAQPGDDRGHYYDLRGYTNFVFYARTSRPKTRIEVKIGALCRDCAGKPLANGDSLSYPIVKEFLVGTNWEPCQISLAPFPLPVNHVCPPNLPNGKPCEVCGSKPNDLSRICSVAFVVVRGDQPVFDEPVEMWLDNIAFTKQQTLRGADSDPISSNLPLSPPNAHEFWVYSNFSRTLPMPFKPYGYMSASNYSDPCEVGRNRSYLDQMMQVDPKSTDSPSGGKGTSIDWEIHWSGTTDDSIPWNEQWAGLCFIAGRTVPPWWAAPGDENGGRYFDLRQFKFLSLWLRAIRPNSHVKVVIGPLARDCAGNPLRDGDSLAYPIERSFTVGTNWTECRVPLLPIPCTDCGGKPNDLSHICSIGISLDRQAQPEPDAPARFWIASMEFTNR